MATTVLYMSMSVDGFIAGPNESMDNGLGDGGTRLHEWLLGPDGSFDERRLGHLDDADRTVWKQIMDTGSVLAGRGTFEVAGGWGGDHHDGVPIVILSRHPAPAAFAHMPLVTYVPDLADAVGRACEGAGEKEVLVHGAGVAQRMLRARLLDEMQLQIIPVLLGQGRALFEGLPAEQIELEPVRSAQGRDALHVRYRVRYPETEGSSV